MKVIIDSNILIPLEDTGRLLDAEMAEMMRLCREMSIDIYIHPEQEEDIQQDRNEKRREIVLSRIKQYPRIPNPPILTEAERDRFGWRDIKRNDRIDNLLLSAVVRRAVSFLVTEDRGLHTKAQHSGYGESVLRVPQFLRHLKWLQKKELSPPVGIELKYTYEFDVEDEFFNSLRSGYPSFNQWWQDISAKGRQLWCVDRDGSPLAICVFKIEDSEKITEENAPLEGRHLKICTFKVGHEIQGQRVGERLLHTAFQCAVHHNISWVYLHADIEKHQQLVSLCLDYGFEQYGVYQGDQVLLKSMKPSLIEGSPTPLEYAIKCHPYFIEDASVSKFIVPVRPEFHERLFPDISSEVVGNAPFFESMRSSPGHAGNTIKKAYICHSTTNQMRSGDLVLFYRSQDRKSIEVVGVVEEAARVKSLEELSILVSKRTVYSVEELANMIHKPCLVVLFRTMKTFPAINLKSFEIAHPQQIKKISELQYKQLCNGGLVDA